MSKENKQAKNIDELIKQAELARLNLLAMKAKRDRDRKARKAIDFDKLNQQAENKRIEEGFFNVL